MAVKEELEERASGGSEALGRLSGPGRMGEGGLGLRPERRGALRAKRGREIELTGFRD